MKTRTVFLTPAMRRALARNLERLPWAAAMRDRAVEAARPWLAMSNEALWGLVFGNTLPRSWMVWSNGFCPACRKDVPMYEWRMDAMAEPWKVRCPHCREAFPKNDFHAFYRSGLDPAGVFDPARADRALLVNPDHPDPADPEHGYGVDDGHGWSDGERRWRFVATYLIYGQWKQAVLGGIQSLADAYAYAGDPACARKATILLDRVADLYPSFDFKREGILYEGPGAAGYVSTWHDACEETRELALAYDLVFEAASDDAALAAFLSEQARRRGLANPKASFADIQRNIEDGILRDALTSQHKIHSNFPRREIANAVMKAVLDWPANRDAVLAELDATLRQATAVDGVTGEKGLPGYSCYTIRSLAAFLQQFERIEPGFVGRLMKRHPSLRETWRFHLDAWCMQSYYPTCGDALGFAQPCREYMGVSLARPARGAPGRTRNPSYDMTVLSPSLFTFLWRLHEATGDPGYVQALRHGNNDAEDSLPWDLYADDPPAFRRSVAEVICRHGPRLRLGSVLKPKWNLAILRAGEGPGERAVWLDGDAWGGHGHADALNLGLFAFGLDLLPDLGYPPVQFGGWDSPRAVWYRMTAAHNTVVVDGADQAWTRWQPGTACPGAALALWADGERVQAVGLRAPHVYPRTRRYERFVFAVTLPSGGFYLLDVFRVAGGGDHARFLHSHFGSVTTAGLDLRPDADFGHGSQMRAFRTDPAPRPGWSVEWAVEDRYGLLDKGRDIRVRHTDLTAGASASLCEGWVVAGGYSSVEQAWIPRVMTRRRAATEPELTSAFVSVLEPYEGRPGIAGIRRPPLLDDTGQTAGDLSVAVEVSLPDGRRDLWLLPDAAGTPAAGRGGAGAWIQPERGVRVEGEAAFLRVLADGRPETAGVCPGGSVAAGGRVFRSEPGAASMAFSDA